MDQVGGAEVTVLGGVKYVPSVKGISARKINKILFIGSVASLIGAYGFVFVFNQAGTELIDRLIFNIGSMT